MADNYSHNAPLLHPNITRAQLTCGVTVYAADPVEVASSTAIPESSSSATPSAAAAAASQRSSTSTRTTPACVRLVALVGSLDEH